MELYKHTYQIQSLYGGRNLVQYVFVGQNVVLVDTGIADTPEKVIFPYLEHLRLKPDDIRLVINTHPDVDHQGGNHYIKQAAVEAWLACGTADRKLVENPQTLYDERYNYLREEHDVGFSPEPLPESGE